MQPAGRADSEVFPSLPSRGWLPLAEVLRLLPVD